MSTLWILGSPYSAGGWALRMLRWFFIKVSISFALCHLFTKALFSFWNFSVGLVFNLLYVFGSFTSSLNFWL